MPPPASAKLVEVKPSRSREEAKAEEVELAKASSGSGSAPASAVAPDKSSRARRSAPRQLYALLRRNCLLKARQPCATFMEVFLPVFIMLMMVLIRVSIEKEDFPDENHLGRAFDNFTVPGVPGRRGDLADLAGRCELYGFQLGFAPDTATTRALAARFAEREPALAAVTEFFESSGAMSTYVESAGYGTKKPGIYLAVVLDQDGTSDGVWRYRIRGNATSDSDNDPPNTLPRTWEEPQTDDFQVGLKLSAANSIYYFGAFAVQSVTESFFIERTGGAGFEADGITLRARFVPFPTPAHTEDDFADLMADFLGLLFALTYLWPVSRLVKLIVEEKESRMKESLRIMGLSDAVSFAAWLITYTVIFAVTALLIVLCTGTTVFENSAKSIIFFFFFFFGLSVFSFCYLVSTLFSRARVASTFGALLFLFAFFPYYAVESSSEGAKTLACLSSPLCFGLGAGTIAELESADQGVTTSTSTTLVDNFRVSTAIFMFLFDFVLYLVLGVYFDATLPSVYGVRRPHFFCCRPSWWRARREGKATAAASSAARKSVSAESLDALMERNEFYEPGDGFAAVRARHLRKVWPAAAGADEVVAVDDINFDLYEDQLFVLLGHNGAGKSTLLNMLTGMTRPSGGDSTIYGNSIVSNMQEVRESLGYCPQFNVLFPLLTVREHLEMLGTVKGVSADELRATVDEMIDSCGLREKADTRSAALSGGQKRMLCVAIALIGGSRIVFLDEPTSGMDPYARRHTWDLLTRKKRGRTIILTTHFMDEADQLGDRIAIMARGNVVCLGSSLFLKSKYGVGYILTVSLSVECDATGQERAADLVFAAVRSHVPGAEVSSRVAGELSIGLPFEAAPRFSALLADLDGIVRDNADVDSYILGVTTMEEVFLRVGRQDELDAAALSQARHSASNKDSGIDNDNERAKLTLPVPRIDKGSGPWARWFRHFVALLTKRYKNARRDRRIVAWQVVYPFLVLVFGVSMVELINTFSAPSRTASTSSYNTPNRVAFGSASTGPCLPTGRIGPDLFAGNNEPLEYNVSTEPAMSETLLSTAFPRADFRESRYGAYVADCSASPPAVTVFYNTTASYSLATYYNLLTNMQLQEQTGSAGARIQLTYDPFPRTADQKSLTSSLSAVMISIAFAFIPASMAGNVVAERESKAKTQQLISGVDVSAYWFSFYAWDFCFYLVPGLLLLAVLAVVGVDGLLGSAAPVTVLGIVLHGLAVIPFTYLLSFLFKNQSSAQNITLMFLILAGAVLLIGSVVLSIIESTRDVNEDLLFVYRLLPSFAFGSLLASLLVRTTSLVFGEPLGPWHMRVSGYNLTYLAVEAVVYSALVLAVEYVQRTPRLLRLFSPVSDPGDGAEVRMEGGEDSDVTAERDRLLNGAAQGEMVEVRGIRKVFGDGKVAVRDLYLGVREGECFGFLGSNGAGKTTALRCLTADEVPTAGSARLGGLDIATRQSEIRELIGFCPQWDALLPMMSPREHLELFSRIKGVTESELDSYVTALIELLTLEPHADKPSAALSGGNKRKLSLGIAMCGAPRLLFLDEPSTGVDPSARREMWKLISATMAGRSVILTTHVLEEAEALCSRIGIFVAGRFRCLGSATHLKSKYGHGYQCEVSTAGSDASDRTVAWFRRAFGDDSVQVLELHPNRIKLRIGAEAGTLGRVFDTVEAGKAEGGFDGYALSSTTLEQVFVGFAEEGERMLLEQARLAKGGGGGSVAAPAPAPAPVPAHVRDASTPPPVAREV